MLDELRSHTRALIILVCVSFVGWIAAAWLAKRYSTDVRTTAEPLLQIEARAV